ncbi:MAG: NAD(P)/FAD-dependent oxidoreductase [bacterium]
MATGSTLRRLQRLFALATWARKHGIDPAEAEAAYAAARDERRAFLQTMAAAAALAALPLVGCDSGGGGDPDDAGVGTDGGDLPDGGGGAGGGGGETPRIAIVGGGMAGLHCAHRLKAAGVASVVYEAQTRVGGRMWTSRDRLPDGLLFEIGGELIDSNHATLWALSEELGLTLDDRWAVETPGMTRETWFFDGDRVSSETLLEQTMAVADVLGAAVEAAENDDDAFAELDATSITDWLAENVPPATYPELHAALSVAYLNEFGLENDEQSILNLLYLFGIDAEDEFLIFGESDERWHTHLGNDAFTTALAEGLGADAIMTDAALVRAAGAGPFTLTFRRADATTFDVEADRVVFALPFTTLRQVDLADLTLSDEKRTTINEIGYGTNAKVMGHFTRRPWWEDHGETGLLTTDLGIQQGWDTTLGQDVAGTAGVWTHFSGGNAGVAVGEGEAADAFGRIIGDLETVWPGSREAWSGRAERMHWPSFPWTQGSYTCYRPGQWAFWSTEGIREGDLHFCGEHCSLDFQGWMEGAAETGGIVAAEILGDLGLGEPQSKAARGRVRWERRAKRLARRYRAALQAGRPLAGPPVPARR